MCDTPLKKRLTEDGAGTGGGGGEIPSLLVSDSILCVFQHHPRSRDRLMKVAAAIESSCACFTYLHSDNSAVKYCC